MLHHPKDIRLTQDTFPIALVCLVAPLAIFLNAQFKKGNFRPGEEHGSAKWLTYTHSFNHIYNPLGVGDYYIVAKDVDDPECAWCLCGVDSLELRRVNVKQEIASVNIGFGKHLAKDKNFASGTPIEQVEKDFASKFKAYSDYSRKFDRELS